MRNHQVRNLVRDLMQPGDIAFFWHAPGPQPGIFGIASIASLPYPDRSQFGATTP